MALSVALLSDRSLPASYLCSLLMHAAEPKRASRSGCEERARRRYSMETIAGESGAAATAAGGAAGRAGGADVGAAAQDGLAAAWASAALGCTGTY